MEHYRLYGEAEGRQASGMVPVGETAEGAELYRDSDGNLHLADGDTTYAALDQNQTLETTFTYSTFASRSLWKSSDMPMTARTLNCSV